MALIKYEVQCLNIECDKKSIILVSQDETEIPHLCPFCGEDIQEINE